MATEYQARALQKMMLVWFEHLPGAAVGLSGSGDNWSVEVRLSNEATRKFVPQVVDGVHIHTVVVGIVYPL